MKLKFLVAAAMLSSALAVPAAAQFGSTPTSNLSLMGGAQLLDPRVTPTPDGGTYQAWLVRLTTHTYAVRLQRLSAAGVEQWPHEGIVVDTGSAQIFGSSLLSLDTDNQGNALVSFSEVIQSSNRVAVWKVSEQGNHMWGASGATVTSGGGATKQARMVADASGGVSVSWVEGADLYLQKLDSSGATVWPTPLNVSNLPNGERFNKAIVASDNGSVVLGYTVNTFIGAPEVSMQKVDALGLKLWGNDGVSVNTLVATEVDFREFPMVSDGAGGAVFCWTVNTEGANGSVVQRVRANGTTAFPAGGFYLGFKAVNTFLAFNPANETTFVAHDEINAYNPGPLDATIRKLDAAGVPQWGSGVSYATAETPAPKAGPIAIALGGAVALVEDSQEVFLRRFNVAGSQVGTSKKVAEVGVPIYGTKMTTTIHGQWVMAYGRNINGGIHTQNILPTGNLGGQATATERLENSNNPSILHNVELPAIGTKWICEVDKSDPLFDFNNGSMLFLSIFPLPSNGTSTGPLLIAPTGLLIQFFGNNSPDLDTYITPVPNDIAFVGLEFFTQAAVLDSGGFTLTNALDIVIGL